MFGTVLTAKRSQRFAGGRPRRTTGQRGDHGNASRRDASEAGAGSLPGCDVLAHANRWDRPLRRTQQPANGSDPFGIKPLAESVELSRAGSGLPVICRHSRMVRGSRPYSAGTRFTPRIGWLGAGFEKGCC